MIRNKFKTKRNRVIALTLSVVLMLTSIALALGSTLASKADVLVSITQPNDYDVIEKGETDFIDGVGFFRQSSSNREVATSTIADDGVTISGLSAGVATISVSSETGYLRSYPYQITDSANISEYNLANGGEVILSAVGKTASSPVSVITPGDDAADTAFDSISWKSLHMDVADVDEDGEITATGNGSAIVIGEFTDKWGVNQYIPILVVVGKSSNVIEDGEGGFWVPGDKDNIYYEADEDGNVQFPPTIIYNPDGPGAGDGNIEIQKGDDGKYYVPKTGYPNIWEEINGDTGEIGGNTIWGGPDYAPGGGDDKDAIYSEEEDIYYINWGQNVFQQVSKGGINAGYGVKANGRDSFVGGGIDNEPGTEDDLTPIMLHRDGKFYAGPFPESGGYVYFIGDRPIELGGSGEIETSGDGSGGHDEIDETDQKWYMNSNGDMVSEKPSSPLNVTSVTVTPDELSLYQGSAHLFSATVLGENNPPQTVYWDVEGNTSASTVISSYGVLAVAMDELAETLTVRATSVLNPNISGTATVYVQVSPPRMVSATVDKVSTGQSTYIIKDDATLWGAGYNTRGQLGNGETANRSAFIAIRSDITFDMVSEFSIGSAAHTVALSTEGQVFTMGYNNRGQLGDGTTTTKRVPTLVNYFVTNNIKIKNVAAGYCMSAAVSTTGEVYTWGYNNHGQLGNGNTSTNSSTRVPQKIQVGPAGTKVVSVSCGEYYMYALTETGELYCWGRNYYGQLGNSSTDSSSTPIKLALSETVKFKAVSAKAQGHVLALSTDGDLYSWGRNSYGQIGDGARTHRYSPVKIMSGGAAKFTDIATGHFFSMAITEDGKLYTWGRNSYGQLGIGNRTNMRAPKLVTPGVTYKAIAAGEETALAVTQEGRLYIWGRNNRGQYGNGLSGTSSSKYVPTFIPLS